jgi:hypothetical protein
MTENFIRISVISVFVVKLNLVHVWGSLNRLNIVLIHEHGEMNGEYAFCVLDKIQQMKGRSFLTSRTVVTMVTEEQTC